MESKPLEHIVFTHFRKYYAIRSKGFASVWENKCSGVAPVLESRTFINANSCRYQKVLSDNLIMIGYSEKALDNYDGRSFVHHHMIVIPYDYYIDFNVHPETLEPYFLTYEDIKRIIKPDEDPDTIILTWPPKSESGYNSHKYASSSNIKDKNELAVALDVLIAAALEKNIVIVDFATMPEATNFLFPALSLLPKQIRALVPFCIGVNPDNNSETDLYRVILRVWPEQTYPLSRLKPIVTFKFSRLIASAQSSKEKLDELYRTFGERCHLFEVEKTKPNRRELIEKVLASFEDKGDGRKDDILIWVKSLRAESLETALPQIKSLFKNFSSLDSSIQEKYRAELAITMEGMFQQDPTEQLRLLVESDEREKSFFCAFPKLLLQLEPIMGKNILSSLATGYMKALIDGMREKLPFTIGNFLFSSHPISFKHDEGKLLRAIQLHLWDSLSSLKAKCKDDRYFKDEYSRFYETYKYLLKQAGKI